MFWIEINPSPQKKLKKIIRICGSKLPLAIQLIALVFYFSAGLFKDKRDPKHNQNEFDEQLDKGMYSNIFVHITFYY